MTIRAENWVGEYTSTIGGGDVILGGAISGFAPFSVLGDGVDVYYTIMDGINKETGIGTISGGNLVRKTIQATLVDGAYVKGSGALLLSGDAQVYGTANADFLRYVDAIQSIANDATEQIAQIMKWQINGHPLSPNFILDAASVGARPDTWVPAIEDLDVYSKSQSDQKYLLSSAAEVGAGLVMRAGGPTAQALDQRITDISTAYVGDTPPAGAPNGKRWYDTISGRTFIKYNDGDSVQWVEESPAGAPLYVPSDRPVLCVDWVQKRTAMWKGYLPADGQTLLRADYPEAWKAIQGGLVPVVPEASWISTPGSRGCFTEGDGSITFRVPDYNGKTAGSLGAAFLRGDGLNSEGYAGVIQGDAIRNITGGFGSTWFKSGFRMNYDVNGVFIADPANGDHYALSTELPTTVAGAGGFVGFNASAVVPTAADNHPVNVTGCWSLKMFGMLNTALPIVTTH